MTILKNFSIKLIQWYRVNHRDLPWRKTKDPYKIWISEVMLQQTTVKTVIPYYRRWIKIFPTVFDVANAKEQTILKMWQGLGYYARAKNIYKSAQIICRDYSGKIPSDPELMKGLPGFGPYTRGAVASIAFGMPYPIIDANIRRVAIRVLALKGVADTNQDGTILAFLQKVIPEKEASFFNQGLMELGALVCRNREPICNLCPLKGMCLAYKKGEQELIPRVKKKLLKKINVVIALIEKGNKYFIQQRPSSGLLADLWEFPGGKVNSGEKLQGALRRELREELNCGLVSSKFTMSVKHFYTEFKVHLHVFDCSLANYPSSDRTHKWVSLSQFNEYPMPSGSAKIAEHLTKTHPGGATPGVCFGH